jgi:hypothetical protein
VKEHHVYATVCRYGGIDKVRSEEVARKVGESLVPCLSELPGFGFGGYCLIDAGESVVTSIGLFENSNEAHESRRVAARWLREQKLESALPNTPKVTDGTGDRARVAWPGRHERRPGARCRAQRTSPQETSTSQRPIGRTVQGVFHESAAAG